ncbi:MAG: hypothetical protein IKA03_00185 [Alphaproteobacteria bacterium]|nr:hypothetical protein [Alphaproteobacteria bacterium]
MKHYVKPNTFVRQLKQYLLGNPELPSVGFYELKSMTVREFLTKFPNKILQNAWTTTEKSCKHVTLQVLPENCTINRIDLFYSGVLYSLDENKVNASRVRELLAQKYAKIVDIDTSLIENKNIMECYDCLVPSDWKGPILFLEEKLSSFFTQRACPRIDVNGSYFDWVTPETKVSELFDLIIKRIENALNLP